MQACRVKRIVEINQLMSYSRNVTDSYLQYISFAQGNQLQFNARST